MKSIFAAAAVFAALVSTSAMASVDFEVPMDRRVTVSQNQQGAEVTRTITNYNGVCVYDNTIYSVGSRTCTTRNMVQECVQDNNNDGTRWDPPQQNVGECP